MVGLLTCLVGLSGHILCKCNVCHGCGSLIVAHGASLAAKPPRMRRRHAHAQQVSEGMLPDTHTHAQHTQHADAFATNDRQCHLTSLAIKGCCSCCCLVASTPMGILTPAGDAPLLLPARWLSINRCSSASRCALDMRPRQICPTELSLTTGKPLWLVSRSMACRSYTCRRGKGQEAWCGQHFTHVH